MKIEHLAIWARNLEALKDFYETYFDARAGAKYYDPKKKFTSYFLSFDDGCRLEIMHRSDIEETNLEVGAYFGIAHFAIAVGSKEKVDSLTERLLKDGHTVVGKPRNTGDGYYESVVLDPEGNRLEITV